MCQIKRPDPGLEPATPKGTATTQTYCRQKRRIYYMTPEPPGHPVSKSV